MTKRPPLQPTGRIAGGRVEPGCGKALVILGSIIIAVCAVLIVLYLTHVSGLWPDWAIEAELVFREAWKAWLR